MAIFQPLGRSLTICSPSTLPASKLLVPDVGIRFDLSASESKVMTFHLLGGLIDRGDLVGTGAITLSAMPL